MSELELSRVIDEGRAVVIFGTGVSAAISENADTANWVSLVRHGIQHVHDTGEAGDGEWRALAEMLLENAVKRDSTKQLIAAASLVASELGAPDSQHYANWLQETAGELPLVDPRVATAIASLRLPVLTTNYDTLFEKAANFSATDWTESAEIQTLLQGAKNAEGRYVVGHLHGRWDKPRSVVLSDADYARVMESQSAQAVQQALAAAKSMIYIGFGSGLSDPNFGALLKWQRSHFSQTRARHYLLCLEEDHQQLRRAYADTNIEIVVYGTRYSDLPEFIESLTPKRIADGAGEVARSPAQSALEELERQVRSTAILGDMLTNPEAVDFDALVAPPVLLPIPHEQYVQAHNLEGSVRRERSDPEEDATLSGIVLVVGEQLSGLTTTLQWLLKRSSEFHGYAAPIYTNFADYDDVPNALSHHVSRQARLAEVIARARDPLPPHVLAIDNLSLTGGKNGRLSDRVLSDLQDNQALLTVIGCRQGEESGLLDRLSATGHDVSVRYLGRLNTSDIAALARRVSPSRAGELTRQAVLIIQQEHLPRNYFTVTMLLSVLAAGDAALEANGVTALLDLYVDQLLGRGDYGDALSSVGSYQRAAILRTVAKRFIERRADTIPQSDCIAAIEDYFGTVGWELDSTEIIRDLRDRRVLRTDGANVAFARSSFLHLFAAKAMAKDAPFRAELFEDPLLFSRIIRHYAALQRDDVEVLALAEKCLDAWDGPEVPTYHFEKVRKVDVPTELPQRMKEAADKLESDEEDDARSLSSPPDLLEHMQDTDRAAFSNGVEGEPAAVVSLLDLLAFASAILRDSEEVEDVVAKTRLLTKVLIGWGRVVDQMTADPRFQEAGLELAAKLAEAMEADGKRREELKEDLAEDLPILVMVGGISQNLSSRRLQTLVGRALKDEAFVSSPHGAGAAAVLALDVQLDGWADAWRTLGDGEAGEVRFFANFLARIGGATFVYHTLTRGEEEALLDFLLNQWERGFNYRTDLERKDMRDQYRQYLRRVRLREARKRLPQGSTVLGGLGDSDSELSQGMIAER